jgi:hypothetical protein
MAQSLHSRTKPNCGYVQRHQTMKMPDASAYPTFNKTVNKSVLGDIQCMKACQAWALGPAQTAPHTCKATIRCIRIL